MLLDPLELEPRLSRQQSLSIDKTCTRHMRSTQKARPFAFLSPPPYAHLPPTDHLLHCHVGVEITHHT